MDCKMQFIYYSQYITSIENVIYICKCTQFKMTCEEGRREVKDVAVETSHVHLYKYNVTGRRRNAVET
jgi:hypothetical protein